MALIGEHGGPRRLGGTPVTRRTHNSELLCLVLDAVHPTNLGALPPSPYVLACKGEQIGLGTYSEFFHEVVDHQWYRRNNFY
jgi:hypothetical protein